MMSSHGYSVEDALPFTGCEYMVAGNRSRRFTHLCSIFHADADSLTWASPTRKDQQKLVERTTAGLVVCGREIRVTEALSAAKCLIVVDNPKLVFARIGNALFPKEPPEWGVHPTATVHPDAKIHPDTYIGPHAYVGRCTIGQGTIIHGHCHIYGDAGVRIGKNVTIFAGCTIGTPGFGFVRNESGACEPFPQVAGVYIGNDVDIHAHTNVDRGALSPTIIGSGTKIDKFCHIGHGVVIGEHCIITPNNSLMGSVQIGDYVWIAPCTSILNDVKVGDHAFIGMGAVVVKNVPAGETMMGVPARPAREYKRQLRALRLAALELDE